MKIFLSYTLNDKEWVEKFILLLYEHDSEILVMRGLGEIKAGDGWEANLRWMIESADLVVSILTEHALHTPDVLFELGAATGARKPILPLLVSRDGETPSIPRGMSSYRFLRVKSPQEATEQVKRYISERMAEV